MYHWLSKLQLSPENSDRNYSTSDYFTRLISKFRLNKHEKQETTSQRQTSQRYEQQYQVTDWLINNIQNLIH